MPETSQEVYHCPSCGALASVESEEERVCAACGYEFGRPVRFSPRSTDQQGAPRGGFVQRNVSAGRRAPGRVAPVAPAEIASVEEIQPARGEGDAEVVSDDGNRMVVRRRRKKRKKSRNGPLLFLCGWVIVVMAVMVAVIMMRSRDADEPVSVNELEIAEAERQAKQEQINEIVKEIMPRCQRTMHEYLAANTWEKRAQLVRDSIRLARVMGEYYRLHPRWILPSGGFLRAKSANLYLHTRSLPVLEVIFQEIPPVVKGEEGEEQPAEPGREREVSFVRQDGRWVIDWEALVNYSTTDWQAFLKDSDGEAGSGEFRVYARLVKSSSGENNPDSLILKFRPPGESLPEEWRLETDAVEVMRDSESGRRLEEIFDRKREDREPGDTAFWLEDREELRRVRVQLEWRPAADNRRVIRVRKVLAGNWLGEGYEDLREEVVEE